MNDQPSDHPIEIDAGRCNACGICTSVCPPKILARVEGAPPVPGSPERCLRCGHCVAVCPTDAVRARLGDGDFPEAAKPIDPETVSQIIRGRRSVRRYRDEAVGRELVERLLEAARYAPTGRNAQAPHFLVLLGRERVADFGARIGAFYKQLGRRLESPIGRLAIRLLVGKRKAELLGDVLPELRRAEAWIAQGQDPLFHHAPAALVLHADEAEETAEVDCAIAADTITLLAPSLGLGTCYIGYATAALRHDAASRRFLDLPAGHRAFVVLTLGRPSVRYRRHVARPAPKVRYL